jgi:hypothetical protein
MIQVRAYLASTEPWVETLIPWEKKKSKHTEPNQNNNNNNKI